MTILREITPDDLIEKLKNSHALLYNMIKNLPLKKAHRVFEVAYSYGSFITHNGVFQFPESAGLTTDVLEQLSYRSVPLGFVLNKGYEVFRSSANHIIPQAIRRAGLEMGIWETFSPVSGFSATAGSRSVFFLPKVADAICHKRLKRYGVKRHAPHSYFDQWQIFVEMAQHKDFPEPWQCTIIYLGQQWARDILDNPKWRELKICLLEQGLAHSMPNRTQVTLDAIWENFHHNLVNHHFKASPYLLETLKHLLMIASGNLPGFSVANETTEVFPHKGIVQTYLKEYGLDQHAPTMMYADNFDIEKNACIYYSLQLPTCRYPINRDKNSSTIRSDLFDLIELTDLLLRDITADRLGAFGKIYYELFSHLEFEFFHSDPEEDKGVFSTTEMPDNDLQLLGSNRIKEERFAHHSSFVRGCVRIGKK